MAAVLYFIYLAARRKMGSERIHALSKPQSIAALVTWPLLVVGTIWRRQEYAVLEVVTLYLLVITAISLTLMVTPNRAEYDKGLWRARKLGLASLAVVGRPVAQPRLPGDCLRHCAGDRNLRLERGRRTTRPSAVLWALNPGSFPLAIAAGVLVIAYFGLAHQYFALRFGGRSQIFFTLFLFLAWLVPLVAGMILAMASISPNSARRERERRFFSV